MPPREPQADPENPVNAPPQDPANGPQRGRRNPPQDQPARRPRKTRWLGQKIKSSNKSL